MHIYEDGKELEQVDIYELTKHDEIVKMMEEKGFRLKSSQEVLQERILKNDLTSLEVSSLAGKSTLYMVGGAMAILVTILVARGSSKGRKARLV